MKDRIPLDFSDGSGKLPNDKIKYGKKKQKIRKNKKKKTPKHLQCFVSCLDSQSVKTIRNS